MTSVITAINNAGSGYTLPTATIKVTSTGGFPASGSFTVPSTTGLQTVSYTSQSGGNQFNGCTGGTGVVDYEAAVTYYVLAQTVTTGTTTFTGAGGITINVASTAGFPGSSIFTFNGNQLVQYGGTTATSFTSCYLANTGFGGLGEYFAGTPCFHSASTMVTDVSATLPQSTIDVGSTTGFPTSGTIVVLSSSGLQTIYYTNTTPTSFTGCLGGSGTITTSSTVYYSIATFTTNTTSAPITTINVQTTAGFPTSGTITFNDIQTVTYTNITATSFTGCSGGNTFLAGTTCNYELLGNFDFATTLSTTSDPALRSDPNSNQANSFGGISYNVPSNLNADINDPQANSFGYGDLSGTGLLTDPLFAYNTNYDVIGATNYKMRGYYVAGQVYETWIVQGLPSYIPPSGHTLIDIIIEEIY